MFPFALTQSTYATQLTAAVAALEKTDSIAAMPQVHITCLRCAAAFFRVSSPSFTLAYFLFFVRVAARE